LFSNGVFKKETSLFLNGLLIKLGLSLSSALVLLLSKLFKNSVGKI
jgi:hypothetical protein